MTEIAVSRRDFSWKQWAIVIPALLAFTYVVYSQGSDFILPITLAGIPLLVWALIARIDLLQYFVFFIIPLSVPTDVGNGLVIEFPSEILIATIAVYLAFTGFLRPVISRDVLRHPLIILLIAEVVWMLCCSFFSNDPLVSLKRVVVRSLFVYIFLIFGANKLLSNGPRYHWLFLLYGIGLIWPVINAFLFHAEFDFSRMAAYKMSMPFYSDHTIYGACIAFVLPMLLIVLFSNHVLQIKRMYFYPIALLALFLVGAEMLSFSRAAWISAIVAGVFGLFLLLRIKLRTIIIFLVVAGSITFAYSEQIYRTISNNEAISNKGDIKDHILSVTNVQSDASNTERINRWMCAWRMAVEKPVTGFGPGMYQFEYGRFQERRYMTRISTFSGNKGHAHSEYFTQLSETGFPGFALFIVIVIAVIGYGMKVIYNETDQRLKLLLYGAVLGLVTFYVHGIFNAFLDTDKMAVLVFGSIAIIVSADLRQRFQYSKFNIENGR